MKLQYDLKEIINELIKAIEHSDFIKIKEIFADNIDNSITEKNGKTFHLIGADNYINAIKRMNFVKIKPSLTLTQVNVLNLDTALFMIEVKAQKGKHQLHNHAAYLAKFANGKIISMDMVEALPEYSDKFWNEFKY